MRDAGRRGAATLNVLCVLLSVSPIMAVGQDVRGQVIDSVSGNPLVGAKVSVLDTADGVMAHGLTDAAGLFLIQIGTPGEYRLNVLSSGYQPSTFPPFSLQTPGIRAFMLLVPTLDPIAQADQLYGRLCPADPENGNLVGWVRNAGNRIPVGNAVVRFSWSNVPSFLAGAIDVGEFTGEARADSSGLYRICGVPRGRTVWLHAATETAASDFVTLMFHDGEVTVGASRFEMRRSFWRHDLLLVPDVQRTTSIRGIVTNAQDEPEDGVTVEILGSRYTTQTDDQGRFELVNVPAGDVRIVARRIGTGQTQRAIHLPQGATVDIPRGTLVLGSVVELDPLIVEAAPPHDALAEFKVRRARGQGSFITRGEFSKEGVPATAVDVLRRMQGIRIYPGRDFERRWVIMMQRGGTRTFGFARQSDPQFEGASPCPPLIFLDRHYIGNVNNIGLDGAIPLETIEAVEAHQSAATLPLEFRRPGASCGVIAFWTRFAQPRAIPLQPNVAKRGFWDSTAFHLILAGTAVVGFFLAVGKAIHF